MNIIWQNYISLLPNTTRKLIRCKFPFNIRNIKCPQYTLNNKPSHSVRNLKKQKFIPRRWPIKTEQFLPGPSLTIKCINLINIFIITFASVDNYTWFHINRCEITTWIWYFTFCLYYLPFSLIEWKYWNFISCCRLGIFIWFKCDFFLRLLLGLWGNCLFLFLLTV